MTNNRSIYKVVQFGCTETGALCPNESIGSSAIFTHAHAIHQNARLKHIGIYDEDEQKAKMAAKRWKVEFNYDDQPDIVVVSSEPERCYSVTNLLLSMYNPKLIVYEAPMGSDFLMMWDMVNKKLKLGPVLVHFPHRFVTYQKSLKRSLDHFWKTKGTSGILSCSVVISANDHELVNVFDLLSWWFGDIEAYTSMEQAHTITYERCKNVTLTRLSKNEMDVFEIKMLTCKGEISLVDHASRWTARAIKPNKTLNRTLGGNGTIGNDQSLKRLYRNAVDYLDETEQLECTHKDALNAWNDFHLVTSLTH